MPPTWKASQPNYWCKFCSTYVRDSPLERRNHEASGKHQNNIQRSLRNLHKDKEAENRAIKRARDEAERLNKQFGGGDDPNVKRQKTEETPAANTQTSAAKPKQTVSGPPAMSLAAQRRAHADQLAKMGVVLPDELTREVGGAGSWQVVSERVIRPDPISGEYKAEGESRGVKSELKPEGGVSDDEADMGKAGGQADGDRRPWGSKIKTYPGASTASGDEAAEDLDALLAGVGATKETKTPAADVKDVAAGEHGPDAYGNADAKAEDSEEQALANIPPAVVFKKRKAKK